MPIGGYGVFPRRGAIRSSEPDPPRCCLGAGESRRGLCPGDRERDYLHFVGIAIGSASEVRYLVGLAVRLGFANEPDGQRLKVGYSRVIRALQALVTSLSSPEAPEPEARGPLTERHWS